MKIRDKNIWVIYGTTLILGTAYGIAISLLAHHLDLLGFDKLQMGSIASWFALGIVVFSLPMGRVIAKVSAKTTLLLCLLGYAATVSTFPVLRSFFSVAVDRFFDGAFSVGIWVSSETILLARAERSMKANVTSLYAVSIAMGYVVGPLVAELVIHVASMDRAFLVSGGLAMTAMLVVIAFLDPDPPTTREAPGSTESDARGTSSEATTLSLLKRIKTSCFATFAYGYFQASVVLFLPLYLVESKGVPRDRTILVTFFFALGMLLFSNVAGRLGDKYGHLLVMRVLGIVGTTMVLGFIALSSFTWMAIAVFVAGATLAAISPVSLALQGVVTEPRDYSRSNAMYNTFYALGMLGGPRISSLLFARYGGGAMLLHLAGLWVAFVLFTIFFWRDDPAALASARTPRPLPS